MQRSMFEIDDRLNRLSEIGDTLEKLNQYVKWESFRELLDEIYPVHENRQGGRKAYDRILMFKIMILQQLYNLSDDKLEYQINDRLSFQRFLGLGIRDKVPDAKTIWLYKERLNESDRSKELFELYTKQLEDARMITHKGTIIDATFMERPHQYINKEQPKKDQPEKEQPEKKQPETDEARQQHHDRQMDTDAGATKKGKKSYFGYKDHVKADAESKLITDYSVTDAKVPDADEAPKLLNETDTVVYLDAGYRGKENEEEIKAAVAPEAEVKIIRKNDGYHEPTAEEKAANKPISKVRGRIEHIFGHMVKAMGGKTIRSVGLARAKVVVALRNLAYNMSRSAYLMAQKEGEVS